MNMYSCKCCQSEANNCQDLTQLVSLLKLVGEENRLKLLCLFNNGERCVCDIPEDFEMSQSLISHHLADLKQAGLVNKRKKGRRAYYSLTKKGQEVINHILALVNQPS